jgi:hypothetical protein
VATTGMSKLDARRMQMLVNQRQKLQEELLALEADVMGLVRFQIKPFGQLLTCIQEKKPLSKMRM